MFAYMARPPSHARPFSSFIGRVPEPAHRSDRRLDLYHQVDWPRRGRLRLESRSEVEARDRLTRSERKQSPSDALEEVIASRSELHRLGVIKDWRRATIDQLGSAMGWDALLPLPSRSARRASELPAIVRAAWNADLIKRSACGDLPIVLQSNRSAAADRRLFRIGRRDLKAITSGTGTWRSPQGGDRHDILATELLIRVAEFSQDVAAVAPESGANHAALITGNPHASQWNHFGADRWGDGVVSRSDGLQVVVELTCTAGDVAKLRRKIKGCVELLCHARFTAVIFVEAAFANAPDGTVWNPLRRAVTDVLAELSRNDLALTRGRLGVARWKSWWPHAHLMADGALTLEAECPTGSPNRPWETVRFLDGFDLPLYFPATGDGLGHLRRAATSPTNPYWLRKTP
jgi:hypothetical protein